MKFHTGAIDLTEKLMFQTVFLCAFCAMFVAMSVVLGDVFELWLFHFSYCFPVIDALAGMNVRLQDFIEAHGHVFAIDDTVFAGFNTGLGR